MAKIIFDTNIWYELAKGNLTLPQIDLPIFRTYINIDELSVTPKLINDFKTAKKIIDYFYSFEENKNKLIIRNPLEYLINMDNAQNGEFCGQHYQIHYESILNFIKNISLGLITEDKMSLIKDVIYNRKNELIEPTNLFQKNIDIRKKQFPYIGKKIDASVVWKTNTIDETKDFIKLLICLMSPSKYIISSNFAWHGIELFVKVLDTHIKKLIIKPEPKIDSNDWYDLFNMIYVQPNDKYWTADTYWLNTIKEAKMSKYLLYDTNVNK